jgi:hypothetical protein
MRERTLTERASCPIDNRLPATWPCLAALLVLLVACSSSGGPSATASTAPTGQPSSSSSSPQPIGVTSSLDGHSTLPHRIHWVAKPSPGTDISEVDFLIDGKQLWVEHNAPYFYGDDGNYLVTSFLKPGEHGFTARVVTFDGATATDTVTAGVSPSPAPPAAVAGTWKRFVKQGSDPASPPSGYWRLIVGKVGWEIVDTAGGGNLLDVAYLTPRLLEVRTGMASGHEGFDLNGWCNDEPGTPVRFRWSVSGAHLLFTFAGGHACPGFSEFVAASWTRASHGGG